MLLNWIRASKNVLCTKMAATPLIKPVAITKRQKKLSPTLDADLRFRIEMCIATGQVVQLKQHRSKTESLLPLLRSVIHDLDRLRQLAPAEELKYRLLLLGDQSTTTTPCQAQRKHQTTTHAECALP